MTTPLLIAGHGTADSAGAEQFRQFVKRVDGLLDAPVAGGFIELSNPPIASAVDGLVGTGARRVAAVPLMLVAAGHAKGDIPASLARERQRHIGLSFVYGRPLGPHPTILALLRERLAEISPDPDTMVLLVGRGSTDPDANAEVARAARLLAETRPGAGVEYAFVSLAEPGVAAGLERCRLLGAGRVAVLPYFLFTGVLPRRVAAQAADWSSSSGVPVDTAEVIGDCDGLASLVVERYDEALRGEARANCDACLYRIALPGHEHRVGAPQMPHDHPHDHAHPHPH
ncbi:sirohydrochlorin chelatase [Planosporangium mesophilum]|uniref:Cobalamin biosynthesis protein CbiX n=1 Tax=Planosporangium mesophilum TaxID=689768 RepID=A0A8J3TAA0_9ACTN|nr:sirohydrochlorin chelatase [Planosporangium mesophilum]NJC86077.1 sirohydrochlorin chelatase [Planosporangium mesophilum]GII21507.1 cobalamin biosynthesis protein CbiX [Planosporangium mesophilum]